MKRWIGVALGSAFAGVLLILFTSPMQGAPMRTASPVEVVNFPVDTAGNLRVAEQVAGAPSATVEVRFTEAEKNPINRFPLIPLPTEFRTLHVWVVSLDLTKAFVQEFTVAFGSSSTPSLHTQLGDFQAFIPSVPVEFRTDAGLGRTNVPGGMAATYGVGGEQLQLAITASNATANGPAPPDAEYLIRLHLTR